MSMARIMARSMAYHKYKRGFTTIFVILIVSAFIIGLMSVFPLIFEMQSQSSLYRHQLTLSRNLLASHDQYLRNAYGLSCYHSEITDSLTLKQYKQTPYEKMEHLVTPVKTLDDSHALLDEMGVVAMLYTVESLSLDWTESFASVYHVTNLSALFSKMQSADEDMAKIEATETSKEDPKNTSNNQAKNLNEGQNENQTRLSKNSIKKINDYRSLLSRCKKNERILMTPSNQNVTYGLKDKMIFNQYVMGSLNDRVISRAHEVDFFDTTVRSVFNQGCEIEYIITGNATSAKEQVEGELFLLRFIINYLEGISSPATMARIESEAAALIGIPLPIGIMIILCLESAARGDEDVKKLLKGEGVAAPVLKEMQMKGTHTSLKLYYDDHLRILLGLIDVAKGIDRFHQIVAWTYQKDCGDGYNPKLCIVSHELKTTYRGKPWSQMIDGYMAFSK